MKKINFAIDLVKLLISRGARSELYDILSDVIDCKCTVLIELIIKTKPQITERALARALVTRDENIIRIVCKYYAEQNIYCAEQNIAPEISNYFMQTVLARAMDQYNPMILQNVAMMSESLQKYNLEDEMISHFISHCSNKNQNHNMDKIDKILKILLCLGAKMNDINFNICPVDQVQLYIYNKIHEYYGLNNCEDQIILKELQVTMDHLIEGFVPKHQFIETVDIGSNRSIPGPLIGIIYSYSHESPIKYIDRMDLKKNNN